MPNARLRSTIPSLFFVAFTVAVASGCAVDDLEGAPASTQPVLGTPSYDGTCTPARQQVSDTMAYYGRVSSNSAAFRECIDRGMRTGVSLAGVQIGPYLGCTNDPYNGSDMTTKVNQALAATRSANPPRFSCSTESYGNAWANIGTYDLQGSENITWGAWFQSAADAVINNYPLCNGSNGPNCRWAAHPWPYSQGAGVFFHEAFHQHGYGHGINRIEDDPTGAGRSACGIPTSTPDWHFQRNTIPYIVGNCIDLVLAQSSTTCGSLTTCPTQSLRIIDGIGRSTCSCVADPAPPLTWNSSVQYDNGTAPSVALSGASVIEVHQAAAGVGPLWYRTGARQSNGTVQWGRAYRYDNGTAPSVALSGTSVVEVHQAVTGVGPLWYHTGVLQPNGTVLWNSSAYQYDYGTAPSVALSGSSIVEVHQAATGVGPLWYHPGTLQSNGAVLWGSSAYQYDYGTAPSVALSGSSVVEVHQATTGVGALWYHSGARQSNGTVLWNSSAYQYDNGTAPSVALSGASVVEVHQATTATGPLWSRPGTQLANGTVQWGGWQRYDNGFAPSVTLSGASVIDAHQAATGVGPLWYRTATLAP